MQSNGGDASAAPASSGGRKHELVPQLQFDPGFHFIPTDEELVDFYLRCKIEGRRPPLDVINEVDIMSWDPVKLIEQYQRYGENRWFFFTKRKPSKTKKQNEPNRKVVVNGEEKGSWSATGSLAYIRRKTMGQETIIGTKRVLTYKSVHSPDDDKWSMHEYTMADKSQMDQYVLCAIQLKQTYEAEKKAQEERKGGIKRKRRAIGKGSKNMQITRQVREEQHETSALPGETSEDPYKFIDVSSVQMMCRAEEDAPIPFFCQGNNSMVQAVQQTEYPYLWCNEEQQPLCFIDQTMITPGCSEDLDNYQHQFYQQADNGNISSEEFLEQYYNTYSTQENADNTDLTLENADISWDNTFLDDNMIDCDQDQFSGGVLIEEINNSTDFVLYDNTSLAKSGCEDTFSQSMGIQNAVSGHSMGDVEGTRSFDDNYSGSLPNHGNGVWDNSGEQEGSNPGSFIFQDGFQQPCREESATPTVGSVVQHLGTKSS